MSLTSAEFTGVSGLLSNAQALSVIGNNISNSNTVGFKSGTTLFADLLSQNIGNNSQVGTGVKVQSINNNFAQGSLESTTNVTDLTIQGSGFFVLGGPTAAAGTAVPPLSAYYTRAGSFQLDKSGLGLVNPDGYKVLDAAGKPIVFAATDGGGTPKSFQKVVGVDSTGVISLLYADASGNTSTLYYAGAGTTPTATYASAVQIAEGIVPNPQGMLKQGGTLFTASSATSGTPTLTYANGASEKVLSNELELSNVDMATELVNMLTTQRAYSANSKTITTADQMVQTVLGLVQ